MHQEWTISMFLTNFLCSSETRGEEIILKYCFDVAPPPKTFYSRMNELQVDFKMEELGSEGSFYAEYDTMRFPEVAPEPNEGTEATLVPVSLRLTSIAAARFCFVFLFCFVLLCCIFVLFVCLFVSFCCCDFFFFLGGSSKLQWVHPASQGLGTCKTCKFKRQTLFIEQFCAITFFSGIIFETYLYICLHYSIWIFPKYLQYYYLFLIFTNFLTTIQYH